MKLEKSFYELRLKLKIFATGFGEPNSRWKESSNGTEPIMQRWC